MRVKAFEDVEAWKRWSVGVEEPFSMNPIAAGVRANDAAAGLRHSRGPWFMVPMHVARTLKLSMKRRTNMPRSKRWRFTRMNKVQDYGFCKR
jgi:hypothetical protein